MLLSPLRDLVCSSFTAAGEQTHALHGFLYKMLDLSTRFRGYRMIVAFDRPEKTFRSEELPSYKENRPSMPMPLPRRSY